VVDLTGSPDHLFSRRSQCLSEAAFTIWLGCAPFCFRLSFAVRARQVRRARGSASPGGWSRVSRRGHVTYSANPARPRCGEGGRARRDIPGRSVTGPSRVSFPICPPSSTIRVAARDGVKARWERPLPSPLVGVAEGGREHRGRAALTLWSKTRAGTNG
jgi:hypothetical protein